MADYKKFARPTGPRSRTYGSAKPSSLELFDAECSSCHNRCQVPFRPNGKKPVYCANCFTKDDSRANARTSERREFSPRPFRDAAPRVSADYEMEALKKQMYIMNQTLERLIESIDGLTRSHSAKK